MSLCRMQNRKTTLSAAAKTYLQKKEKNSSLCLVWFLHADVSWLPLLSRCVILGTEQCRMCVLSAGTVRHGYTCTLTHRLRNTCLSWIHGNRLQDRISWETICLHFQPLFLLDAVVSDMIRWSLVFLSSHTHQEITEDLMLLINIISYHLHVQLIFIIFVQSSTDDQFYCIA